MKYIPKEIVRFLLSDGLSMEDKFKYMIQSIDGDEYYLQHMLPSDGYISQELGQDVYECLESIDIGDLLILYSDLVSNERGE